MLPSLRYRFPALAAGCLLPLLVGCGPEPEPPATFHPSTPAEAAALSYFTTAVKPVLRQNCYRCHFGMNHKGNFNLSTRDLLLKGGKNGVDVVPGDPDHSTLMKAIRHEGPGDHPMPMPPKDKLEDRDIAAISKWIADGAVMDR
jgi:cytochrome c